MDVISVDHRCYALCAKCKSRGPKTIGGWGHTDKATIAANSRPAESALLDLLERWVRAFESETGTMHSVYGDTKSNPLVAERLAERAKEVERA